MIHINAFDEGLQSRGREGSRLVFNYLRMLIKRSQEIVEQFYLFNPSLIKKKVLVSSFNKAGK